MWKLITAAICSASVASAFVGWALKAWDTEREKKETARGIAVQVTVFSADLVEPTCQLVEHIRVFARQPNQLAVLGAGATDMVGLAERKADEASTFASTVAGRLIGNDTAEAGKAWDRIALLKTAIVNIQQGNVQVTAAFDSTRAFKGAQRQNILLDALTYFRDSAEKLSELQKPAPLSCKQGADPKGLVERVASAISPEGSAEVGLDQLTKEILATNAKIKEGLQDLKKAPDATAVSKAVSAAEQYRWEYFEKRMPR